MGDVLRIGVCICSLLSEYFWFRSAILELLVPVQALDEFGVDIGDLADFHLYLQKASSFNARAAAFAAAAAFLFFIQAA